MIEFTKEEQGYIKFLILKEIESFKEMTISNELLSMFEKNYIGFSIKDKIEKHNEGL